MYCKRVAVCTRLIFSFMPPVNELFGHDFIGPFEPMGSGQLNQQHIRAQGGGELYSSSHFNLRMGDVVNLAIFITIVFSFFISLTIDTLNSYLFKLSPF